MKKKTIRLSDDYVLNGAGIVEGWFFTGELDEEGCPQFEWRPTKYKIGTRAVLVSHTDVSPNAIRSGQDNPEFSLRFDCPDGVPGNSNRDICRYHGWRGTTDDVSLDAYGEREIIEIRRLKNGQVAVTVGKDLRPDNK